MSFGIASSKEEEMPDKLLGCTDQLLYSAKAAGKNQAKFESGFTYRFTSACAEIAAGKQ
jgi:diguanylate cyclase